MLAISTANVSWARSYARQALSDLGAREMLVKAKAEKCHRLHFLQMAAEKACKAYQVVNGGVEQAIMSRAVVLKVLPTLARDFISRETPSRVVPGGLMTEIRKLALEIEVLAPACVGGGARQDKTEYPWLDTQGQVCTPREFSFQSLDDNNRNLAFLIKLIRKASIAYAL